MSATRVKNTTTKEPNMPEELSFADWHATLKGLLYGTVVKEA